MYTYNNYKLIKYISGKNKCNVELMNHHDVVEKKNETKVGTSSY